ncbi:MAG: hypothetical protein GEU94_10160 [Micromonosporaceae bacterium]|nr:hypothetical protein [Micromonosporaceae bacterium]
MLGDEFWLIAHQEHSGRPRLSTRVLGLGLAGALLGELVFCRSVTVVRGQVHVVSHAPPPDELAHWVLGQVTAEATAHTLRTWLVFLSRNAHELVAQRMWHAGKVQRETSRRVLKQVITYLPADAGQAAWAIARLSNSLRRQAPMDQADAFLAGLALATGLDQVMLDAAGRGPHQYLSHVVGGLVAPLHEIVVHTQAAVGDAVLSQRA